MITEEAKHDPPIVGAHPLELRKDGGDSLGIDVLSSQDLSPRAWRRQVYVGDPSYQLPRR